MEHRLVRQGLIRRAARAEELRQQLDEALRVVDVGGSSRPVPGPGLERASQGEPKAPPLVRRVVNAPIALADLEDRDVIAALAKAGRLQAC